MVQYFLFQLTVKFKMNLAELINESFLRRSSLVESLIKEGTDAFRIFHGVNEGRSGLTVDRYGRQVLIQTFQDPLNEEEIRQIRSLLPERLGFVPAVAYNHRNGSRIRHIPLEGEEDPRTPSECREMGVKYRVIGQHRGLDPLLFLDLRAGRRFIMERCSGKSLLNLFAYTCGVGTAAAAAGASEVWNVDFASSGLQTGRDNAALNDLPLNKLRFIQQDVFPVIRQFSGLGVKGKARRRKFQTFHTRSFDLVFLDPPTWARSPFGAVDIVNDYQGLFKPSLLCLKPGGTLVCTNHAASVELSPWLDQLERCASKAGKEIESIRVIPPESDFPSPDGKHPLKIAAVKIR
jgi:23S rRNA (cytosine1962-C5)-methyltransferase